MKRVLLTGAAGKVGKHVVRELTRRGFEVVASDLGLDGIPGGVRFHRCDLTDADAVHRMVSFVRPDVVVHAAAVVAPIAYADPELADAVNLGAARHLIDATERHVPSAFFVFVSSCAAFGPASPTDPIRCATDVCRPRDNYGAQKLTVETWLRESKLRQCSLRLGAVLGTEDLIPKHASYRPFVFMVSLDQPEHGVDVRDVARAVGSAAAKEPDGYTLLIGGDSSWRVAARQLRRDVFGAVGLPTPSERAFRRPTNPNASDGWFYECWMDTDESEKVLGFQRVTREAYMTELKQRHRTQKWALLPLRAVIGGAMLATSPYVGPNRIVSGPTIWDDICRVYDMPSATANAHGSAATTEVAPRSAS
ncbi:MAG: NAD(P)-dependent oxidoreductase [Polyangiales bacterium]